MNMKRTILQALLAAAFVPLLQADSFTLTGAGLACSNLSDWSATIVYANDLTAGGGTDGGCGPSPATFGLDFSWLLSPFAESSTFNNPDGLGMFGFVEVSGAAPKTPHKTRSLTVPVTWDASGGGSTPDGLVDFTFAGSGYGTATWDFEELFDHSIRLNDVRWNLTATTAARFSTLRPDPVPEPSAFWFLGTVIIGYLSYWAFLWAIETWRRR